MDMIKKLLNMLQELYKQDKHTVREIEKMERWIALSL